MRVESKEQKVIRELVQQLGSKDEDKRAGALNDLSRAIFQPALAPLVVRKCQAIARCLQDPAVPVRSLTLKTLRMLAEHGGGGAVAMHCRDIVACLQDEDMGLRSKAAALCRVLAEEGCAPLLASHVPSLVACFEGTALVTPLDALRALVDAGEVQVVAHGISRIVRALESPSTTVRIGACETLAAIGREGGGDLLRRLRFIELADRMAGVEECKPLLDSLTSAVQCDEDYTARLAAARALQAIAEADAESSRILRERHSYPLVQVMCWSATRKDDVLYGALQAILGKRDEDLVGDKAEEQSDGESGGEDTGEDCVICQRNLCKHGGKRTLPCKHVFHKKCVGEWFSWSRKCWGTETCPLCRSQKSRTFRESRR